MKIESAFFAHQGGRDEQQDHVDILKGPGGRDQLLVVADGMGGHAGGQIASRAVVETARKLWSEWDREKVPAKDLLGQIVETAHETINRLGQERGIQPRSTCVLLYLSDASAVWAHVGDSRLFRFSKGEYVGRTRDHSVPQMLLDMGKIREGDVASHPDQNRLTQSLGGDVDPEPDFDEAALAGGDGFLLCSDGLWERVSTERMAEALYGGDLDGIVRTLPVEAYDVDQKSSDNISIAVAVADGAGVPAGAASAASGGASGRRSGRVLGSVVAVFALGGIGAWAAVEYDVFRTGPDGVQAPAGKPNDLQGAPPKSSAPQRRVPGTGVPKKQQEKPKPAKIDRPKPGGLKEAPVQKPKSITPKNVTPPVQRPSVDPPKPAQQKKATPGPATKPPAADDSGDQPKTPGGGKAAPDKQPKKKTPAAQKLRDGKSAKSGDAKKALPKGSKKPTSRRPGQKATPPDPKAPPGNNDKKTKSDERKTKQTETEERPKTAPDTGGGE